MKKLCLIIFCLASAATELSWSQSSNDEDIICAGAVRHYIPDINAIKSLSQMPVPEDFKTAYKFPEGCLSWASLDQALVTTHLKYGTEDSLAAALTFLESEILKNKRSPEEIKQAAETRADLLPKLEAANQAYTDAAKTGEDFENLKERIRIRHELTSDLNATSPTPYAIIAPLYVEVAEFYVSPIFSNKASELLDEMTIESEIYDAVLSNLDNKALDADRARETYITLRNLQERIAIVWAQIEPTPNHIEAAHNLLLARYHRAYREYGEAYYGSDSTPESICDIPEEDIKLSLEDEKKMVADPFFNRLRKHGCDHDNLEPIIRTYWRRVVTLETLMTADPENFRRMTRAETRALNILSIGFRRPNLYVRRTETDPAPEAGNLPRAGRAFFYYSAMMRPFLFEDTDQLDRYHNPFHELAELLNFISKFEKNSILDISSQISALKWVEPYEHPGLWKKLAVTYLESAEIAEDRDILPQQYSYVKHTLENLSAISTGELGGE